MRVSSQVAIGRREPKAALHAIPYVAKVA